MVELSVERAAKVLGSNGQLRVAINYGNSVLAQKDPVSGEPGGVSVDLAKELATRLSLNVKFYTFEAARSVVEAIKEGRCELAFLAIDPLRGEHLSYTEPYVKILGGYLTAASAPYITVDDVDQAGIRIAVGKNAAYDLYLSRTITKAELRRASTTSGAVDLFLSDKLDLAAGIKPALLAYAQKRPGLKVLDGAFMEIKQAIGVPRRFEKVIPYLNKFVAEMLDCGFIQNRLEASGQDPNIAVSR
ncbi:MAG: transporter substrate-binding domain-containing protein [Desulfocapsaceae bacterium]